MAPPLFVVVSGPPASGKSTLAPVLARDLGLPLVAKDTIKDALMSELAVPDVEASQQLGRAAVAAMLAVGAESPVGAVIESNFYRSVAVERLGRLPGTVVEVFCLAIERFPLTGTGQIEAMACRSSPSRRHVVHPSSGRAPSDS